MRIFFSLASTVAVALALLLPGCTERTCPAESTMCGAACVSLVTDAANCGGCGHACPPGQLCASGVCACASATPDKCGSGAGSFCTSTQTDTANYGACGNACSAGQQCSAGACKCPIATPNACGTGASGF